MSAKNKLVLNRRKLVNILFVSLAIALTLTASFVNKAGHKMLSLWLVLAVVVVLIIGKIVSVIYQNLEDNDYNLSKKHDKFVKIRNKEIETGSVNIFERMFLMRYQSLRKWQLKENIESINAFLGLHISGPQDVYAGIYVNNDDVVITENQSVDNIFAYKFSFNEFLPKLYKELITIKNLMINNPNTINVMITLCGLNYYEGFNATNSSELTKNEVFDLMTKNYDFNYTLVFSSVNSVNYALYYIYKLLNDTQKNIVTDMPIYNQISDVVVKSEKANLKNNKPEIN